jgi:hypothetical protein
VFRRTFLCEFVRLDQRSVWVKFRVVLVPFARFSLLEFVGGYKRLDRPLVAGLTAPRPLGGVLVFAKIFW